MSAALYALGRFAVRRRRLVLACWVAGLILVGALAGLFATGTNDVYEIPGTQSQQATDALTARFPQFAGATGQVVVSAPAGEKVTDPAVKAKIATLVGQLSKAPGVDAVASPFDSHVANVLSPDGTTAIVSVQMSVPSAQVTDAMRTPIVAIAEHATAAGLPTQVGGSLFMPTTPKVGITEGIGVVVALLVLVLTFGSLLVAGVPMLTAVFGVGLSTTLILTATRFLTVTSTAPFLALMIGLAVGIDYALFIISRHRDLLAEGLDPDEAAAQATGTAGSAVIFAGATVAVALAALSVAQVPFLSVMGVAGAVGVAAAVLVSLTLLPAILGFGGRRFTPRKVAQEHAARHHVGVWAWWSRAVTRLPALTAVLVIGVLAVLTLPARDLQLALPTNGTSAPSSTQRKAYDTIAAKFGPGANAPLVVTLDIVSSNDPLGVVAGVKRLVLATPGISSVTIATPNQTADTGVVVAIPDAAGNTTATRDTLARVRALAPEIKSRYGVDMAVTGQTAAQVDVSTRLSDALLPFGLVVVGISLLLLALVFRSIWVPVTAALGYLLSVGAAFGAVAAVFQWGWFAGPLNQPETMPVISFMPILVMGVLFGLAMDYQVFLVSSIRARYVHEGDAARAVRTGFVDAGKVVTAAAIIMTSVFVAFVPHGSDSIKPIALGLAVGVFVDAFLVRMTLIPAVMALLGERAWWLPGWLDRHMPVLDVEGESLHRRLAARLARGDDRPPAVQAGGLTLRDGTGTVFQGIGVTLEPGEVLVVEGAPGAGKTSLLLALAGRMPATDGTLQIAGLLLPDQAGQARSVAALAEMAGINDLDPLLTVGDHIAERLATTTWHPWVSRKAVDAVSGQITQALQIARSAEPAAHADARLERHTPVRDLRPLERWVLGVSLALVGEPQVVFVDDIDALRGTADQSAAWAVLADLAGRTWRPQSPPLAVVVSCRSRQAGAGALSGRPVHVLSLAARPTVGAAALELDEVH